MKLNENTLYRIADIQKFLGDGNTDYNKAIVNFIGTRPFYARQADGGFGGVTHIRFSGDGEWYYVSSIVRECAYWFSASEVRHEMIVAANGTATPRKEGKFVVMSKDGEDWNWVDGDVHDTVAEAEGVAEYKAQQHNGQYYVFEAVSMLQSKKVISVEKVSLK